MLFSGKYYAKRHEVLSSTPTLFELFGSYTDHDYYYLTPMGTLSGDADKSQTTEAQGILSEAVVANKALFISFLDISIPSVLRRYIGFTPLKYWRFDWRGNVPVAYRDLTNEYYGERFKKQYEMFMAEATDTATPPKSVHAIWSMISHYPYIYDQDGVINGKQEYREFEADMSEVAKQKTEQNYIAQLQYVDFLVGELIEKLKQSGRYDDAVIMILTDHGISNTGSNYNIDDQVTKIPFLLKVPGVSPGANDRDVQLVDVAPTLADILGISINGYDGQSLLRPYQARSKIIYALGRDGYWEEQSDGTWQYKQ